MWGPSQALVSLVGLGLAASIVGPQLYCYTAEVLKAAAMCPAGDCKSDARTLLDLPEGAPPSPSLPLLFLDPTRLGCPSVCFSVVLVCTRARAQISNSYAKWHVMTE